MFISFSFSCSFHVQFNVHFYFIHLLHFISLHFTSFHVIQSQKNLACLCLQTNQRRLWLATGSNVEIGTNTAMEFATAKNSASEQLQILWKSVEVSVKLEFVNLFGGRGGVLLNPISILLYTWRYYHQQPRLTALISQHEIGTFHPANTKRTQLQHPWELVNSAPCCGCDLVVPVTFVRGFLSRSLWSEPGAPINGGKSKNT